MLISALPTRMPTPFADSGAKTTIPIPSQISVTPGAASYTDGFPPLTRTAIVAGGVPPYGTDFNGILNAITVALRWGNAGGMYAYDATFSAAVGGYPKGALIATAAYDGYWQCTVDGNTTNPDTGGAGWVAISGALIAAKAPLNSPALTGTPTAPIADTLSSGTNQIATLSYVRAWARKFAGAGIGMSTSTTLTVSQVGNWINLSANGVVATLPDPSTVPAGQGYLFRVSNTGSCSLASAVGNITSGVGVSNPTLSLASNELIEVVASGSTWWVVARGNSSGVASVALVQSGAATFGTDTGTANTYVVAFTPAITARTEGQILSFKANTSNTGACTINDGVAVVPLVGGAHSALQGGEIVAGGDCLVQWNSTVGSGSYVLIECGGGAEQVGAATKSNHAMRLGQAVGRLIAIQVITATGTYTPTTGATTARITVIGGGAAGGTAGATTSGTVAGAGGGGAGGVGQSTVSVSSISGTTATIGSAGAPSSSTAGGAGGATTFGGITASGGTGGALVGPLAPPQGGLGGSGGTTTGGNVFNMRGGNGMHGQSSSTAYVLSGSGGSNPYGGGGPGNLLSVAAAAAGSIGQGFGAGGGGGASNSGAVLASGANGTTGAVIIEEFS